MEQLKLLASKLAALEFESKDPQSITSKVTPLLNDILLSNLSQKDSQTIEILSDYLADIITRSSAKDLPKLSHALQSVISPAISQEIENNKDKMIDTLYPIMGGMISKYVTQSIKEMMESINKKIEDGLSFDRYKRKFKSKLTGVSEVELLLEESSDADISSLLVIHKETGLLIAEAHAQNSEMDDAVMVASMASAIKDFVNDWIQNQDQETLSEVQILSYGNATLYIESAGSVYMIAFMDSEPDFEQRKEINGFFATNLKRYSKLFHSFEGDMNDTQIQKLESDLREFLNQHNDEITTSTKSDKPNIAKYIFYVLGVAMIGWFGYQGYKEYQIDTLASDISNETNSTISLHQINKDTIQVDGYIDNISQYKQIEKLLNEHKYTHVINNLHMPIAKIYDKITAIQNQIPTQLQQTQEEIEKLNASYQALQTQNLQQSNTIDMLQQKLISQISITDALERKLHSQASIIDDIQSKTKLIAKLSSLKKDTIEVLHSAFAKSSNYVADGSFDFHNLFAPNSTEYDKSKINLIKDDYDKYISILYTDKFRAKYIKQIIIEGYTDSSGNSQKNIILSSKRAKSIKNYLQTLPITKKYDVKLISKGMGSKDLVIKNGVEDKNASRRIKIRFELDEKKIINDIKRVQR